MGSPKFTKTMQKKLDGHMQKGYAYAMEKDVVAACREWLEAWKVVVEAMDRGGFASIEELDGVFGGKESIYDWASVFELELGIAASRYKSFAQERIDFCTEFISRYRDKGDIIILNMKLAIAASYFRLGKQEEGDRLFSRYLKENPDWGWGWIGWADEYWYKAEQQHKNRDKAIFLLKKALDVEGLQDREEVLEKLNGIYEELGLQQGVDGLIIDEQGGPRSDMEMIVNGLVAGGQKGLTAGALPGGMDDQIKVGRNETCPCGSGKKYKKCCGN